MTEATMEYNLYFQPGFEWKKGGKLPGLCGGECPRGCTTTRGNGWSARLMWQQNGGISTYVYWPEMPNSGCGVQFLWDKTLETGVWYNITTYVKMNTPGVKNGVAKGYVNGKLVFTKSDFKWVEDAAVGKRITFAYITTYAGGKSVEQFAPSKTQYLKCDFSQSMCIVKTSFSCDHQSYIISAVNKTSK